MRITNLELVRRINRLNDYANMKLPQRISYAITRNLSILNKEYSFYSEQLDKVVNEYSDHFIKDEGGSVKYRNGVPEVEDIVVGEYNQQINDLLAIEFDIDLYFVDPSVFDYDDNGKYDTLSANEILVLQSLICKNEEEGE